MKRLFARISIAALLLCLWVPTTSAGDPKGKAAKTERDDLAAGLDEGKKGKPDSLGNLLRDDAPKGKRSKKAAPPPLAQVSIRVHGKASPAHRRLKVELERRKVPYARCFAAARERKALERFDARFTLDLDRRGKVKATAHHPKDPLRPKRKRVSRPLLWLCLENALEEPLPKSPFKRPIAGRYELTITLAAPPKPKAPQKKFIRRVFAPGHGR